MYVETLMSDGSGDYKKPFGLQGIGVLLRCRVLAYSKCRGSALHLEC